MDKDTTNNKINYLKLNDLEDVKALVCDVLTECRDTGSMVEHSGRICNLLQVFLKCYQLGYEVEKVKGLEERIRVLEEGK